MACGLAPKKANRGPDYLLRAALDSDRARGTFLLPAQSQLHAKWRISRSDTLAPPDVSAGRGIESLPSFDGNVYPCAGV